MEMKGQVAVAENSDSLSAFVKSARRAELQHNPPMDECLEWNVEINLNLQGKCTFQTDPGEITFTAEAETEGLLLYEGNGFNKARFCIFRFMQNGKFMEGLKYLLGRKGSFPAGLKISWMSLCEQGK